MKIVRGGNRIAVPTLALVSPVAPSTFQAAQFGFPSSTAQDLIGPLRTWSPVLVSFAC